MATVKELHQALSKMVEKDLGDTEIAIEISGDYYEIVQSRLITEDIGSVFIIIAKAFRLKNT
jgi:hypothetical protein